MLVKYIVVIQFSIFLDQEIAQTPLFRMRYDSLLNSKLRTAWPQAARKALRRYLFHDPSAWGSHYISEIEEEDTNEDTYEDTYECKGVLRI